MDILQYAMLVSAAGWLVFVVIGWADQLLYPPLKGRPVDRSDRDGAGRVTVLIPARNEAANIADCVRAALDQTYPDVRVIVTDDQSTDETPRILDELAAEHDRLEVIHGEPLREGWIGKGWALYQAHRRAEGDWIVLLDADVRLKPWAIDRAVAHAEQHGIDFLNPIPRFVNKSFWERVMQPLLWGMVRLRFPYLWVNPDWAVDNMAFGPMILVRQSVYDAVDGHAHVAMDILEDVALAKLVRRRGYRTRVVNGKHLLSVRMYNNLKELMDGWIKTAFGAMNYNLPLMIGAILGMLWAAMQPVLTTGYGLLTGEQVWITLGGLQSIAIALRRMVDHRENDFELWTILLHPIAMAVVTWMQVLAVWRYYFGAYTWKGRDYHKPQPASADGEADVGKE